MYAASGKVKKAAFKAIEKKEKKLICKTLFLNMH